MITKHAIYLAVYAAGLTMTMACSDSAYEGDVLNDHPYRYVCEDKGEVFFHVDANDTAILEIGNDTFVLAPGIAASGAKYSGTGVGFWTKGQEATLTLAEDMYNCEIQRSE